MRFNPTNSHSHFVCFVLLSLILILSCSKDSDLLNDALFNEASQSIEEREAKEASSAETEEESSPDTTPEPEIITEEVSNEEDPVDPLEGLEARTTSFPPIQDAHYQSGKLYNQHIIRLEEGHRTSYLKFDLGQIDSIGGHITAATLQFTISSDDGDGTIKVFRGETTDWTEHDLSSTPKSGVELGSLIKQYKIGSTEEIPLEAEHLRAQSETLIMDHEDGNDLAFASKEHPSGNGPKLVVTYNAPEDAEIIVPVETDASLPVEEATNEDENEAPMAVADGSPSTGKAPLEVTFKGSNSTDDKEITSYQWNFKDGSSSNIKDPTHVFDEPGTYNVLLKVTDEEGLEDTDIVTITVNDEENEAPKAVVTATPTSGVAPLEVQFKGSNSTDDNGISSYSWNFKDGTTASNANPSHTFNEAGEYKVSLTVEDENGLTHSKTITITVEEPAENEPPKAVATATPSSGIAPLEVQFKGSNSTDDKGIDSYHWDFKDGSTATSKNPSHTFSEAGEYKVKLTVTDEDGLQATKTVTITVSEPAQNEPPKAVATATPNSGDAPLEVQFKGSNSTDDNGIATYHWDFKDGSTATSKNPSHTFTDPGEYKVKLTVKDDDGLEDTKTVTINVTQPSSGGGNNGNYPSNAVFASDFGYKSGDATEAFEDALNSGNSFIVIDKQSSDWIIKPTRIYDLRNTTIVFESGVVLRAKSGAFTKTNDILLQLARANNVEVRGYGATLKMNKGEYSTGEHRHALSIAKGNNVTVKGLTLRDSGGDGIHIAGMETGSYSQDITIEDILSTNNKRQGMTIVSAKDVWVKNSVFEKTNGTKPEAGVDLEPNFASERLVNINFINCKFRNNDAAGFMIAAGLMTSSSTPISVTVRDSEFSHNSKSPGSGIPKTEIRISAGTTTNTVRGTVRFERVTFNGSNHSIMSTKKPADAFNVIFKDCTAKDVVKSGTDSPIELQASSVENTLGGFTFTNFYIEYTKNVPFMEIKAPSTMTVKNITGSFTIKEPNDHPLRYTGSYNPSKNVNVSINYNHIN